MSNAEQISSTLSDLIGLSDRVLRALVRVSPSPDRLPEIVAMDQAIDGARALMVEGGNPVDWQASMLVEVIAHVERYRQVNDRKAAEKCAAIAMLLLPSVQEQLGASLDLWQGHRARVSEGGRYR